jgi:hypothetical protein
MKLNELARAGVLRIRRPMWETAYLRLDLFRDQQGAYLFGPWYHLFDRACQQSIDEPTPQTTLNVGDDADDYAPYEGPIDPADNDGLLWKQPRSG